ncbi:hypothetical protein [Paucidesulfovibrio longus]|uniref:hypothetical protein n=1 Tax=Paucidesulfovibrio longus TaxID=889 RepID=UPI0003B592A9|nr:hypothetical protein [Paucidesulfovibrio longus]
MNKLAITVTLALEEENLEDAYLDFLLTVDGTYLHDSQNHWVDPMDLAASAAAPGEYFIFTCNCGDPGCVGIDEGILVGHDSSSVTWKLRTPLGWPPEDELPEWTHEVEYRFPLEEYVQVVAGALRQAKTLVRHWRSPGRLWVGPDMTVEELMALEVSQEAPPTSAARSRFVH